MRHERCRVDRRLVWVKQTGKWQPVRAVVSELFERHAEALQFKGVLGVILAWRRSGADRTVLSATGAIKSDLFNDLTGSC